MYRLSVANGKFGEALRNDVKNDINEFKDKNGVFGWGNKLEEELGRNQPSEYKALRNGVSDISKV